MIDEEGVLASDAVLGTVVETDDRVILFLLDKRRISEVERLFQVKSIFL